MAGEKILEKSEAIAPCLKSESITEMTDKEMVSRKEGKPSDSLSSIPSLGNAATGVNDGIDQATISKPGVLYPPTGGYDHYYAGYNGTLNDDQGYFNAGIQSDNGSYLYYLPSYNPYSTGFIGSDGKQQPYTSSGYLQQPTPTWCSTYGGDVTNSMVPKTRNFKSTVGTNGSVKSNGFHSSKTNHGLSTNNLPLPLNSESQQSTNSSNFSKYSMQSQPIKQLNKFGSNFQSGGHMNNGFHPVGKFPPYINQNQGFMHYGPINYQTNGRVWNGNFRSKSRENFNRNGVIDASTELTRGPRANGKSNPSKPSGENELSAMTIQRKNYNKEDFKTQYDHAKFHVIKSFSEDDIHKCVKYDVWSSTPNGNKKLDTAFCDAERKASETGTKCPVFLFFSVNGSGQFVGVAEMTGRVDFNKKLDFWQLDKWSGFFPVKWHIVKDVPNNRLRHIILENNDNRAVTYSRDTQEIGLKEGLEMLNIFKSYSEKSALVDDFDFYEDRERSLKAKRSTTTDSEASLFQNKNVHMQFKVGDNMSSAEELLKSNDSDTAASSLISLTKNLSLNSQPLESI
ncbi:PREDICTED: uncharacterized protein LOC109165029 isoform X1 [Ipomoea nil]|uniref:uncharacterized protein LOC109165029 isoform X1 n=1 Tax=Ipomoea nil TaxID=35883 RepID=UPI000901DF02|nr:PREDICTED: uncharacterized protein LOC109165029 isoform X1 [Ipomoea nil]